MEGRWDDWRRAVIRRVSTEGYRALEGEASGLGARPKPEAATKDVDATAHPARTPPFVR